MKSMGYMMGPGKWECAPYILIIFNLLTTVLTLTGMERSGIPVQCSFLLCLLSVVFLNPRYRAYFG